MDIEKLIEQLKWWAKECDRTNKGCQARRILQDAATALSTLQDENVKLRAELEQVVQKYETAVKLQVKMTEISNRQMAELEQVKRALAMMWFSYVNSDKEMPHSYETEALDEAERILGPWDECMPKYLRREED